MLRTPRLERVVSQLSMRTTPCITVGVMLSDVLCIQSGNLAFSPYCATHIIVRLHLETPPPHLADGLVYWSWWLCRSIPLTMSFESWGGHAESPVRCRLPSCGHVVCISGPSVSGFACPTCGAVQPSQSGLASRDYVPTANLTWQGATCKRINVLDHACLDLVRHDAFYVLLCTMVPKCQPSRTDIEHTQRPR